MGQALAISQKTIGFSSTRIKCVKDAWRGYAAQRWARGTQDEVRAEWGLTEWEARSVVYGQISQATEDKIYRSRNWTLLDAFDFLLYRCSTTCNELADQLDAEAENGRQLENRRSEPRQRVALRLAGDRELDQAPEEIEGADASRGVE